MGKPPPSPRFYNAPHLHAARRAAPESPKKKGTLPDALAPLPTELLPIAVMVCNCGNDEKSPRFGGFNHRDLRFVFHEDFGELVWVNLVDAVDVGGLLT